jgi:hypothetical protein
MVTILVLLALLALADALVDAWNLQQSVTTGEGWDIFSALMEGEADEEELLYSYRVSILWEAGSIAVRLLLAVAINGYFYAGA